jgi:ribosome-associated toxin RatA of RatAB toxin-antitoxin module
MPIVEASATIAALPDAVFAVSQDHYLRLKWDPFLREIKFLGGTTEAIVGGQVWVKARNGFAMTVEYRVVQPPTRVAVTMVGGPFFLDQFGGTWSFEPVAGQQTRATFRYSFRTRSPILRPILDPVIRLVFSRDIQARVEGLKTYMEAPPTR